MILLPQVAWAGQGSMVGWVQKVLSHGKGTKSISVELT
jgi:hypothetical protein